MNEFRISHTPVMMAEVLQMARRALVDACYDERGTGALLIDGTAGEGGHSLQLVRQFPGAVVLSIDRDEFMLQRASWRLTAEGVGCVLFQIPGDDARRAEHAYTLPDLMEQADEFDRRALQPGRIHLGLMPFSALPDFLKKNAMEPVFVLLDLGVSMFHFQEASRGFSYTDSNLDMRLSSGLTKTAEDLVNKLSAEDLADLIYKYGDERFSRRIARFIVKSRPIDRADRLAEVVSYAVRSANRKRNDSRQGPRREIHPATRVFQALRIAVNDELGELEGALARLPECLQAGGVFAIISFHSLEDRAVKLAFRERGEKESRIQKQGGSRTGYALLSPRPMEVTPEEAIKNPAARSSKLRALQKLADKQTE